MKRLVTTILIGIFLFTVNFLYASTARITSQDKGVTLVLPYSFNNKVIFAGTYNGLLDGVSAKFYVADPVLPLIIDEDHQGYAATIAQVTYIINNFYPRKPLPYPGAITENKEAAAVQLAVWHYQHGLTVDACNPYNEDITEVKQRANAIITDARENYWRITPVKDFFIKVPPQSFERGRPVIFRIEAYDDYGRPVKDISATLTASQGNLSSSVAVTALNGESEFVTMTPEFSSMSSVIYANADIANAKGMTFRHATNTYSQRFLTATPEIVHKTSAKLLNWWLNAEVAIKLEADRDAASPGDIVNYTLTFKNKGLTPASNVRVLELLPPGLALKSFSGDGIYNPATGIWDIGTVPGATNAVINISAQVVLNSPTPPPLDIGKGKEYNAFASESFKMKGSDAQGKVASKEIEVINYNVGKQLPPHSGSVMEAIIKLSHKSGRVENGRASYGNYIDTAHCNLADDGIKKETTFDMEAEKAKQQSASTTLGAFLANGMTKKEYGKITFEGTDPEKNIFEVSGDDLSQASEIEFKVPQNKPLFVNVRGDNFKMENGYKLDASLHKKVVWNLVDAINVTIKHIPFIGTILAPKATVDFQSGTITGTLMAQQVKSSAPQGCGQFNWIGQSEFWDLFTTMTSAPKVIVQAIVEEASQYNNCNGPVSSHTLTINGVTSVKEKNIPAEFSLSQNYPNPFNPRTNIRYAVAKETLVDIKIYDATGEIVAHPVSELKQPGEYNLQFNATDLTSGVYFYRITAGDFSATKKMQVIK